MYKRQVVGHADEVGLQAGHVALAAEVAEEADGPHTPFFLSLIHI